MPIHEFFSPDTNRIYSFYARTLAQGRETPRCPDNPKARMERLVSRFAVTGRHRDKENAVDAPEAMDPHMERVMAEMEREMATMNDDNPDPRQIGRMMRKMAEATGQKTPGLMQEMIHRLEQGESPEKLEAEYGDSLENLGDEIDLTPVFARLRKSTPQRDPTLYERRDYLA